MNIYERESTDYLAYSAGTKTGASLRAVLSTQYSEVHIMHVFM
jgi:hypothetical protein